MADPSWADHKQFPEEVYLVLHRNEWPISVLVDDRGGHPIATRLEHEVERRRHSSNGSDPGDVKVFRAKISALEEIQLVPAAVVPASIAQAP